MIRRWHKIKAWFGVHPQLRPRLSVVVALLAVGLFGLTLWLHSDESSALQAQKAANAAQTAAATAQRKAEKAAEREGAALFRRAVCPLIYAYLHPVAGTQTTGRTDQVNAGWHAVGALIGCPNGTPPPARRR